MKRNNIFWGLFFILSATLIILNQFDILIGVDVCKLIISLLLLPIIFVSIKNRFFGGILFPLAIIAIIFDKALEIEQMTPWPILGVALFLSIGLSFIFPNKYKEEIKKTVFEDPEMKFEEESLDGSEVNVYLKFGASTKYISSQNLRKVNINCSFSGTKIFFDNSNIDGNDAVVNIASKFSGIELYVPRGWHVKSEVDCVLGGIEDKGVRNSGVVEKVLILRGKISFSGITIVYI